MGFSSSGWALVAAWSSGRWLEERETVTRNALGQGIRGDPGQDTWWGPGIPGHPRPRILIILTQPGGLFGNTQKILTNKCSGAGNMRGLSQRNTWWTLGESQEYQSSVIKEDIHSVAQNKYCWPYLRNTLWGILVVRGQGQGRWLWWNDIGGVVSCQRGRTGVKSERRDPTELWRNYAFHPSPSRWFSVIIWIYKEDRGRGGDQEEGAKGGCMCRGPGQGELHRVQNPCRATTPCRGPPQFQYGSASPQTCNHLIFDTAFKAQAHHIKESQSTIKRFWK